MESPVPTLITQADPVELIGASIAQKLSAAMGPVAVLLPARGVSAIDKEGQPFHDPLARQALHDAIRDGAPGIEVNVLDRHINDPEFADALAELAEAFGLYEEDRAQLLRDMDSYQRKFGSVLPATNDRQQAARKTFDPIAERIKGLRVGRPRAALGQPSSPSSPVAAAARGVRSCGRVQP